MIGALITFAILYVVLYSIERTRTEVDGFSVATVAGAPVIGSVLVAIALGFLYPDPLLLAFAPLATLLIITFLLLKKLMELSTTRSIAYTTLVLALNVGIAFLFAPA